MSALTVTPAERGITRVFAVDGPADEARALTAEAGAALSARLGCGPLDMAHVELFPVSDLGPLDLSDYLMAGAGLPREAVEPDRAALDGIAGHVLILHSRAFGAQAAELIVRPPLRWIGTYALPGMEIPMTPLRSAAANPGPVPGPAPAVPAGPARRTALIVVLLIVLVAAMLIGLATAG